jgi:RND family efflux transporter MFP subunit
MFPMKKSALFKTARVAVVLVVSLVIFVLLVILRPEAQRRIPVQKGPLVEVMPVKTEKVHMVIETFGTVEPREALKLVAEVNGQIVSLAGTFEEGNLVQKDTVLVKIDPRKYELEVERCRVDTKRIAAEIKRLEQELRNLKTNLEIAESDTALAKADYSRQQKLVERNVVSQATVDKAEQRYLASFERLQSLKNQMALFEPRREQLIAQRDMCKVMQQRAELDLEKTEVIAPFSGWVLERTIETGQHVAVGQYLGTIYPDGALEIEVRVPVKDVKWLPSTVDPERAIEADIIFENDGTRNVWPGRLIRMKAQMEERTRTLPVIIGVDNARSAETDNGLLLRPGMFVTIRIKGKEIEEALVLPRHVVHLGDLVYTVKDNRLKMKEVQVLRSYKDTVIITKGLSNGEQVIKSPLASPVDGMAVRIGGEEGEQQVE